MGIDYTKPKKIETLCILRRGDDFLLGMKKVRFGKGKYNGYGGKLDEGETLKECLVREVKEESGLDLIDFEKRGVMIFELEDCLKEAHIYEGLSWAGEPVETEEMAPFWFKMKDLPFDKMWTDDILWYPLLINKEYFEGWLIFDKN